MSSEFPFEDVELISGVRWIELTSPTENKRRVLVNIDQIAMVIDGDAGALILLVSEEQPLPVLESYDEISARLDSD